MDSLNDLLVGVQGVDEMRLQLQSPTSMAPSPSSPFQRHPSSESAWFSPLNKNILEDETTNLQEQPRSAK